jgi:hypothetical protein
VTIREFGTCIDQAIDKVAVGAPGSYGNIGMVYVYNRVNGTTDFSRPQVLWSGNAVTGANDRFGSSISLDQYGTWLYVGAPGNDRVYVYGLNTNVTEQQQIVSINDRNTIRLSSNVSIANGTYISYPVTGALATVLSSGNTFVGSS